MTSLASPRIVVVHGATTTRRNRGMDAFRDRTITGRRPVPGGSHHQTSPRSGRGLMSRLPPVGMTPDRPIRQAHRSDARGTHWHRPCRSRPHDVVREELSTHRRSVRHPCWHRQPVGLMREGRRRQSCLSVIAACHEYGMTMPYFNVGSNQPFGHLRPPQTNRQVVCSRRSRNRTSCATVATCSPSAVNTWPMASPRDPVT